jgi:hypothetical protein
MCSDESVDVVYSDITERLCIWCTRIWRLYHCCVRGRCLRTTHNSDKASLDKTEWTNVTHLSL